MNRPLGIITVCKGLSLNDCFWVDAEGSGDTFEKVNLYDNRFSQVLAAIAFTGYGSSIRTSLASCPEFSTNGMLPKCWRRQNGKIYLYKGGTSGVSNQGFEPYSELYAYQVAQVMGVNAIRYTLTKDLKKTLCSKCELFTSKEYSYIPIGQLVSKGGIKAIFAYYQTLGQNFVDALEDMLVFDAIICNTDRHYGNFGVLVDNNSILYINICDMLNQKECMDSLGDNLLVYCGATEGYWKDLKPKGKKYMLLRLGDGDFVRSAGVLGGDMRAIDVNNRFVIVDGIDYKSNSDIRTLWYMEV